MKSKLIYTDLLLFHQIVYGKVNIEFPYYLSLRSPESIRDRGTLSGDSGTSSGDISSTVDSENIIKSSDNLQYRSTVSPKVDAFKYGFFYRTHIEWNCLPLSIRMCSKHDLFCGLLKEHLWKMLLEKPD